MRKGRPVRRTGWARLAPARALRECVLVLGVKNVMRRELSVEVYGLDELRQLNGPALIGANQDAHLPPRHSRTAVNLADQTSSPHSGRGGRGPLLQQLAPIERVGHRFQRFPD